MQANALTNPKLDVAMVGQSHRVSQVDSELIWELSHLFLHHHWKDNTFQALGIDKHTIARNWTRTMLGPTTASFVTQDQKGISGFMSLEPKPASTALIQSRIWKIKNMLLRPDALGDPIKTLIEMFLVALFHKAEFVYGMIPQSDQESLKGFFQHGFRVWGEEVVAVAQPKNMAIPKAAGPYSIEQVGVKHIDQVVGFMAQQPLYQLFGAESGFDPQKEISFQKNQLINALKNSQQKIWLAKDTKGDIQGVVHCTIPTEKLLPFFSRIAFVKFAFKETIDHAAELALSLQHQIQKEAARQSIEAVLTKLSAPKAISSIKLFALNCCGYRITERNQILSRWLSP